MFTYYDKNMKGQLPASSSYSKKIASSPRQLLSNIKKSRAARFGGPLRQISPYLESEMINTRWAEEARTTWDVNGNVARGAVTQHTFTALGAHPVRVSIRYAAVGPTTDEAEEGFLSPPGAAKVAAAAPRYLDVRISCRRPAQPRQPQRRRGT